jgi:aminoglycoside phosphotransferase (APT) family kinase protein
LADLPETPTATLRDDALAALSRYWDDHVCGTLGGPLEVRLVAGGRSNPTYEVSDGHSSWILRRPPEGHLMPSTHDMSREVRMMRAVADTAVPVPTVVAICDDSHVIGAPFYVMRKLEGTIFRSRADTGALSVAERRQVAQSMVTVLASLHQLDPGAVGLTSSGNAARYLERQLDRWEAQWHTIATRPLPRFGDVLERLRSALPRTKTSGIVHGDFKIDNVMFADEMPRRAIGVLDWEMSTLGDTWADLGFLVSCWDEAGTEFHPLTGGMTAWPGFPGRTELVGMYATARGVDAPRCFPWYVAFADFKMAIILEQIHARHAGDGGSPHGREGERYDVMVGPLFDRAYRMLESL